MRKQIISLALCLTLFLGLAVQAVASDAKLEVDTLSSITVQRVSEGASVSALMAEVKREVVLASSVQAITPTSNFRVNGVAAAENVYTKVYGQTTYVSLRDFAQAVRPGIWVEWDGTKALVWADDLCVTAVPGQTYVQANDRYLYVPDGVKTEAGTIMVPVRIAAKAFDATITWEAETGISVTAGSGAIASASSYYNSDDLYWLSHIIYAESGNQPLSGKIAVGNVILNRVKSSTYPNSIYSVVFQRNQFTPVANGSINRTPNTESVIAAKLCLDGAVVLSDAMYFNRAGLNCWASRNRPFITTIAGHSFYA